MCVCVPVCCYSRYFFSSATIGLFLLLLLLRSHLPLRARAFSLSLSPSVSLFSSSPFFPSEDLCILSKYKTFSISIFLGGSKICRFPTRASEWNVRVCATIILPGDVISSTRTRYTNNSSKSYQNCSIGTQRGRNRERASERATEKDREREIPSLSRSQSWKWDVIDFVWRELDTQRKRVREREREREQALDKV